MTLKNRVLLIAMYRFLATLMVLSALTEVALAQNPVPQIDQALAPQSAVAGGPGFMLTVNGTGFVSDSIVMWNGSARATRFVSPNRFRATIPATDIAAGGTAWV